MHTGPRLGGDAGKARAAAVIADKLIQRAHELSSEGAPYVIATVVRDALKALKLRYPPLDPALVNTRVV